MDLSRKNYIRTRGRDTYALLYGILLKEIEQIVYSPRRLVQFVQSYKRTLRLVFRMFFPGNVSRDIQPKYIRQLRELNETREVCVTMRENHDPYHGSSSGSQPSSCFEHIKHSTRSGSSLPPTARNPAAAIRSGLQVFSSGD